MFKLPYHCFQCPSGARLLETHRPVSRIAGRDSRVINNNAGEPIVVRPSHTFVSCSRLPTSIDVTPLICIVDEMRRVYSLLFRPSPFDRSCFPRVNHRLADTLK